MTQWLLAQGKLINVDDISSIEHHIYAGHSKLVIKYQKDLISFTENLRVVTHAFDYIQDCLVKSITIIDVMLALKVGCEAYINRHLGENNE